MFLYAKRLNFFNTQFPCFLSTGLWRTLTTTRSACLSESAKSARLWRPSREVVTTQVASVSRANHAETRTSPSSPPPFDSFACSPLSALLSASCSHTNCYRETSFPQPLSGFCSRSNFDAFWQFSKIFWKMSREWCVVLHFLKAANNLVLWKFWNSRHVITLLWSIKLKI